PEAHPALVDLVDRALKLRLADRWPDARTMQAAIRDTYATIYGEDLPGHTSVPRLPRPSAASHDAIMSVTPRVRGATTVAAPETTQARRAVRQRYTQRLALGAAILLAAVLGIAGVERDGHSENAVGARALLAEVGEGPSGLTAAPTPPAMPAPTQDVVPVVAPRTPPTTAAAAPVRVHHRSIYDRRY
ncbi:MAG TPA: hypothetical protein VHS09_00810, partial [Polyangiaceae bacterium]|nr:hypothetical protein [Polyangiaceae bacterium]